MSGFNTSIVGQARSFTGISLQLKALALEPGAMLETLSSQDILLGTLSGGAVATVVSAEGEPIYRGPKLEGSAGFFPAGRRLISEWGAGPLKFLMIGFDPAALCADDLDRPDKRTLVCAEDETMVSLQRAIGRELERPADVDTDLYLESMAVALRTHLLRRCAGTSPTRAGIEDAAVERVKVLVRERLSTKLDISSVAAEVGLTRSGLLRAFVRSTGTTLHAHLMGERLRQAKALLETTKLPVNEIAVRVGYANHAHLTTQFARKFGMTPSAYRYYRNT